MNTDIELFIFDKIFTEEKFAMEIEKIVYNQKISYLEAITQFCENTGVLIEDVPKLISNKLKKNIEAECLENKLLKERDHSIKLI